MILYIYDLNKNSIERWTLDNKIKAISFSKHPINQRLYIGDLVGDITIFTFKCT